MFYLLRYWSNNSTCSQEAKEDIVSWSCKLHKKLDLINQRNPMTGPDYEQQLRARFWNGLYSKFIKEALRHRYDNGEEFDTCRCRARFGAGD